MRVEIMEKYEPKVYISKLAYDKMIEYINQCDNEIGWLATAIRIDEGFFIEDAFLFEQEVHSATTEIKEEGLNNFAMELMSTPGGVDIWNKMRVWGHSHVNISTSPSSQDDEQMKLFTDNPNEFFIRIIGNKKEDFRVDVWDFETGLIFKECDLEVHYEENTSKIIDTLKKQIEILKTKLLGVIEPNNDLKEEIKEEIKLKVKEKTYSVYNYNNYGNYGGYSKYGSYANYGKTTKKSNKAEEVFNVLSKEECYLIMETIDCGGSSEDVLGNTYSEMNYRDYEELDDLICDYINLDMDGYTLYLSQNYNY